ncbi:glycoside hydrolase family 16 protein [Mycena amicta]|nr:glycoside hydrolase family 16 protein [Mycena amicta]
MSNPPAPRPGYHGVPGSSGSPALSSGFNPPQQGYPQSPSRKSSFNSTISSGSYGPQASLMRKPAVQSGALSEESRYMLAGDGGRNSSRPPSLKPSLSEKYHLAADPAAWGSDISHAEADDALHDPRRDYASHNVFTARGVQNVGCILLICCLIVGLFIGYPVSYHFTHPVKIDDLHVNATGQVPKMNGNWGLIDQDTPHEFYKIYGYHDPSDTLQLVFSDEFEKAGRTFYPGDDPYWEAVDLHYWATGNLEWYDPSAITTRDGYLEVNLSFVEDNSTNHNLNYKGGMMSTWNKFCFTGGAILANVMLPGTTNVFGLWPAIWTMGNLGRAGYGATLDGMWPYAYDSCDVGTMPNQTLSGGPPAALDSGSDGGELSFLPGQRLSRCTCLGESHPGPIHSSDGSYVGRSAPEIDIFEAQIGGPNSNHVGQVSQSAQWAPFNAGYTWDNSSDNLYIASSQLSNQNSYSGGVFQQATSVVSTTNQDCYQLKTFCFAIQGFEYIPGYDSAYITWISDGKVTWTLAAGAVGADPLTNIAARPITEEPLYILINLGISHAFGFIDFEHLTFPSIMRVDWIRVYQHPDRINIGCDPEARPTSQYINTYIDAYSNPNLTTWVDDYGQTTPRNKLNGGC